MNYLESFGKLNDERKGLFTLTGNCLLVEELPDEEFKTDSGIIIAGNQRQVTGIQADKPTFVRILLVGEGYFDEDTKETIPCDSKQGDIVLIGAHGVRWFSVFGKFMNYGSGNRIGICRETEIQMHFQGQEGFDKTFNILNTGFKNDKTKV